LIPFCKDCLLSTPQEHIDLAAESVLLYVFSHLSSENASQNSLLQRITDLTNENFSNPELSISAIADDIGYNSKYLSHFFKEKMNVSYSEYLRSVRFKYAISLFEHGLNSIKNVSYLCGYSDPLYFSSSFKKEIGVSPKEFISQLADKK
jgi:two-component system response regulator YesN